MGLEQVQELGHGWGPLWEAGQWAGVFEGFEEELQNVGHFVLG